MAPMAVGGAALPAHQGPIPNDEAWKIIGCGQVMALDDPEPEDEFIVRVRDSMEVIHWRRRLQTRLGYTVADAGQIGPKAECLQLLLDAAFVRP